MGSVLDKVRWEEVNRTVGEQRPNREKHFPVISTFRWWARRQHAVIGSLLDAAEEELGREGLLIADPFSGGGTVAIEAARRGLSVYAQDLYPWPIRGLATALTPASPEEMVSAGRELLEELAPLRRHFRHREGDSEWEATHVLRVRTAACPSCECRVHLFREPLISLASRRKGETDAFFGCRACGDVTRRAADVRSFGCSSCGRRWSTMKDEQAGDDIMMQCPHCRHAITYASACRPSGWEPILIQERIIDGKSPSPTVLRPVRAGDPVEDTGQPPDCEPLLEHIPDGVETRRLLACGYRNWADLYTRRQAHVLLRALEEIKRLDYPESVRGRLALAVLGAAEMPGYLCRWDRYNLKAFEAVANHRYAHYTCVAAETNLLSEVGRGTLPRRLLAAEKALSWLAEQDKASRSVKLASTQVPQQNPGEGVLLAEGSSTTQLLPDGTARLVLTDPPYHDDVQYGELARLFHIWLRCYDETAEIDETSEATPNAKRGTDTESHESLIGDCLAESRRALAPGGRLILTFHNNDLSAWKALAGALRRASFAVVALAVVDSENASDHSKRGKRVFVADLVLECVPHSDKESAARPLVATGSDTDQGKNLLAIGLAVAEECALEVPADRDLRCRYTEHLEHLSGGVEELIR